MSAYPPPPPSPSSSYPSPHVLGHKVVQGGSHFVAWPACACVNIQENVRTEALSLEREEEEGGGDVVQAFQVINLNSSVR